MTRILKKHPVCGRTIKVRAAPINNVIKIIMDYCNTLNLYGYNFVSAPAKYTLYNIM